MTKKNDAGPAFPVNGPNGDYPGMSLRDWFAGQAMTALVGQPEHWEHKDIAEMAYELADTMLKARENS